MDSTGWFEWNGFFEYGLISLCALYPSQDRLDYGAVTKDTQISMA